MPRYSRVKGEAEQAVLDQGIQVVSIFRPSLIIGSQHTPWALTAVLSLVSPLMPAKYRPIQTTQIARAMVAVTNAQPTMSAIYTYKEMSTLAASEA